MQRVFTAIATVAIVAVTLALITESSAQSIGNLPVERVCQNALNASQSAWEQNPKYSAYVTEAVKRSLTIDACRLLLEQELRKAYTPKATDDDPSICLNALNRERTA